jgi:phage baseplate assembly protein W
MALVQRRTTTTPQLSQPEVFSDFLTNLDLHPIKKDVVRNINEEAVKRSIKNLLLTGRGERLFNVELGSDVRNILFEPTDPSTEQVLEGYITKTIENYEPRALLHKIRVLVDNDTNTANVTIIFSIINTKEPIVLELLLNRIR